MVIYASGGDAGSQGRVPLFQRLAGGLTDNAGRGAHAIRRDAQEQSRFKPHELRLLCVQILHDPID